MLKLTPVPFKDQIAQGAEFLRKAPRRWRWCAAIGFACLIIVSIATIFSHLVEWTTTAKDLVAKTNIGARILIRAETWLPSGIHRPQGNLFTVLVARFDGDPQNVGQGELIAALENISGCTRLAIDRTIRLPPEPNPDNAAAWGNYWANRWLAKERADLLLWGFCLDRYDHKTFMVFFTPRGSFVPQRMRISFSSPPDLKDKKPFVLAIQLRILAELIEQNRGSAAAAEIKNTIARLKPMIREWQDAATKATLLQTVAIAYDAYGRQVADVDSLKLAVEQFRAALDQHGWKESDADWAVTQYALGRSLQRWGEIEVAPSLLKEAAAAYRSALRAFAARDDAGGVAMAQAAMARTYRGLAFTTGDMNDFQASESAVRAALSKLSEKDNPKEWWILKRGLAEIAVARAKIQCVPCTNTQPIREAIQAGQNLLQKIDRKAFPLVWADLESCIGVLQSDLGEGESSEPLLRTACGTLRQAIAEWSEHDVPSDRAMANLDLGNALFQLGRLKGRPEDFRDAVVAYDEALKTVTRDKWPYAWAAAQAEKGKALLYVAERKREFRALEDAQMALDAALEIFTQPTHAREWADIKYAYGCSYKIKGEILHRERDFDLALDAFAEVLKVRNRESESAAWAEVQRGVGDVRALRADLRSDAAGYELAIAAYDSALTVWDRKTTPCDWADATSRKAIATARIAIRNGDRKRLAAAVDLMRSAVAVSEYRTTFRYLESKMVLDRWEAETKASSKLVW